ncbi:MAG TPA: PhzF family phenazine biosynthesis protein [Casimicrobiaceae bacterium]|nr:PhzF family phenazine biosynthesis protein [Casimicrobiaceae bacterium]
MSDYAFRIVNVFAEAPLAGNPLAVLGDARGLDAPTMQAIALQFNLSETTFVTPSTIATRRVRIFTPAFEMPFAGHPTLGTAHVVRALAGGNRVTLEMQAGVIPVSADGDVWTLTANAPKDPRAAASREDLAAMLALAADDLDASLAPLWIDTGSEQLVIPLRSFDAVRRARPSPAALLEHASNGDRALAYVFARESDRVLARFFFSKYGAIAEDPGTGSACANLGGYLLVTGAPLPQRLAIDQGEAVGRPCRLGLAVETDRSIRVSGRVVEIGRGTLSL